MNVSPISNRDSKKFLFTTRDEKGINMFKLSWLRIRDNKGRFKFEVYRKPALANVQINPYSSRPTSTIIAMSKGFHASATKITFEKHLSGEVEYLTQTFCEKGYDLKALTKLWK